MRAPKSLDIRRVGWAELLCVFCNGDYQMPELRDAQLRSAFGEYLHAKEGLRAAV